MHDYEFITQHIIMEKHLNAHRNLFGGAVLAWLDEAAAMYVMEKIRFSNIVTVSMNDVYFKNPGKTGENIKIYGRIEKVKNSSIIIDTTAMAVHPVTSQKREIITCLITFVCLDEDRKPYAYFKNNPTGVELKKQISG